jgi:hypothetical protein
MANWAPLRSRLEGVESLTLPWSELDALVGGLPPSAYNHAAFWGGDRSAWSGFRTRNVCVGQSVTFVRLDGTLASARLASAPRVTPTPQRTAAPPASSSADVVLVSCVKEKQTRPGPAKDLYVSALFHKERAYAEASGAPWFILSAEHGLVEPEQVLAPYELRLSDTSIDYRRASGARVVRRLADVFGSLAGKTVEVHAGAAYSDPIRELLRAVGATVVEPLTGLRHGERLAWYNGVRVPPSAPKPTQVDASEYVTLLRDKSSARTPAQFLATNGEGLRSPGLYSWWVDAQGATDLSRGLCHEVEPGMIYAGLAGATRERSRKQSSNTLWLRISGMHLGGRHEFSTLRLTLGSALVGALGWDEIDEAALTKWMHGHLRVIAIPVADADSLARMETAVLDNLDPPLNLSKVAKTDRRRQLTAIRRQYSRKKRRAH